MLINSNIVRTKKEKKSETFLKKAAKPVANY